LRLPEGLVLILTGEVLAKRWHESDRLGRSCDRSGQRCLRGDILNPRLSSCTFAHIFRFALSLRNLEETMAERNVHVDHVTIWRWSQDYAPELSRRCRRELRNTNGSWRVDETYLRVANKWTYLYRAVDSTGDTIDSLRSAMLLPSASSRKHYRRQTILVHESSM
jgi:hypothetical protein